MRDATIARNYADALFELTLREGTHEDALASFEAFAEVLEAEPRIRTFLETPKIAADVKKEMLRRVLDAAESSFVNFVCVVMDHDRQRLLRQMALELRALVDERKGRLHVDVTLAREPAAGQEAEIAEDLSRKLGKEVVPHVRVNPSIMGGVVVRFGDQVMDGSLKRRLATLRHQMLEADLPPWAASES